MKSRTISKRKQVLSEYGSETTTFSRSEDKGRSYWLIMRYSNLEVKPEFARIGTRQNLKTLSNAILDELYGRGAWKIS